MSRFRITYKEGYERDVEFDALEFREGFYIFSAPGGACGNGPWKPELVLTAQHILQVERVS